MSKIKLTDDAPAMPIATAPRDGTWFRALGANGLKCKARFLMVIGPSGIAVQALFSEFGTLVEATSWLPFL
jgi:hypothetical protein